MSAPGPISLDSKIARVKELLREIDDAPWLSRHTSGVSWALVTGTSIASPLSMYEAQFCAAAIDLLPSLIAEIERLRGGPIVQHGTTVWITYGSALPQVYTTKAAAEFAARPSMSHDRQDVLERTVYS